MSGKEQDAPFESATIAAEACAWIAQVESGNMTREDVKALEEWVNRSPRHAEELRRYAHLWNESDILTEMAGFIEEARSHKRRLIARRPFRAWAPRLAMALVALAVFVTAGLIILDGGAPPGEPLMVSTSIGEQRQVNLPDGSGVNLNTNSETEVDYGERRRRIRLLKGEAFFDVAEDERPFLVHAGDRVVRAVGTAFAVRLKNDALEVTVTEGAVELSAAMAIEDGSTGGIAQKDDGRSGSLPTVTVTAGQFAVSGQDVVGHVEAISREALERKLAWRNGELEFSGEPLTAIIDEVSRYTPLKIVIGDPALQKMKVGGIFRVGETEALFQALEESFEVDVEQKGDVVYLSAAERE